MRYSSTLSLTLERDKDGWSTPRHGPFTPPGDRSGTQRTGSWVGPRAGLQDRRKSRPRRNSITGPSSPQPVAVYYNTLLHYSLPHYTIHIRTQYTHYSFHSVRRRSEASIHSVSLQNPPSSHYRRLKYGVVKFGRHQHYAVSHPRRL